MYFLSPFMKLAFLSFSVFSSLHNFFNVCISSTYPCIMVLILIISLVSRILVRITSASMVTEAEAGLCFVALILPSFEAAFIIVDTENGTFIQLFKCCSDISEKKYHRFSPLGLLFRRWWTLFSSPVLEKWKGNEFEMWKIEIWDETSVKIILKVIVELFCVSLHSFHFLCFKIYSLQVAPIDIDRERQGNNK